MINFESGGCLIQSAEELPDVPNTIWELFADFETSSGDPQETATNPWRHCKAIGVAVAFDDSPIWFVPRELLTATSWWKQVMWNAEQWVNHNVKYDAHVSKNDLGVAPCNKLRCTLTDAKLIDSDRIYKGGYGLDVLSKAWLGIDIDGFGRRLLPYLVRNKDYGRIPLDILAEYACADVHVTRLLSRWLKEQMPEESQFVWRTEQDVTSLLYKIEQRGILVNPQALQIERFRVMHTLLELDGELEQIVGRPFRPAVNDDCYDVLCNQYGLPVLAYTDSDIPGPSFDKEALELYVNHPQAPTDLVKKIQEYRKLWTFNNLFLNKFEELNVKGWMHPTANQSVRTGRMSFSEPNPQQFDANAKALVVPPPGYGIVSADFSQIEFRFIVHYLDNRRCIEAYLKDPWTDFHQWVAEMVPTKRKPAKTLNFMMGYGGGKKKTVAVLSVNKDVVGDVIAEVDAANIRPEQRQTAIARACEHKALAVYDKYHALLPELKPTSRAAAAICAKRGYARNHYGRRRHLPTKAAHNAFNSVCQSSAGDLMKERMVALDREVPEFIQIGQVHDCVFGLVPLEMLERDDSILRQIVNVMNDPTRPLCIPIRASIGWSDKNWAHAASEEREIKFR